MALNFTEINQLPQVEAAMNNIFPVQGDTGSTKGTRISSLYQLIKEALEPLWKAGQIKSFAWTVQESTGWVLTVTTHDGTQYSETFPVAIGDNETGIGGLISQSDIDLLYDLLRRTESLETRGTIWPVDVILDGTETPAYLLQLFNQVAPGKDLLDQTMLKSVVDPNEGGGGLWTYFLETDTWAYNEGYITPIAGNGTLGVVMGDSDIQRVSVDGFGRMTFNGYYSILNELSQKQNVAIFTDTIEAQNFSSNNPGYTVLVEQNPFANFVTFADIQFLYGIKTINGSGDTSSIDGSVKTYYLKPSYNEDFFNLQTQKNYFKNGLYIFIVQSISEGNTNGWGVILSDYVQNRFNLGAGERALVEIRVENDNLIIRNISENGYIKGNPSNNDSADFSTVWMTSDTDISGRDVELAMNKNYYFMNWTSSPKNLTICTEVADDYNGIPASMETLTLDPHTFVCVKCIHVDANHNQCSILTAPDKVSKSGDIMSGTLKFDTNASGNRAISFDDGIVLSLYQGFQTRQLYVTGSYQSILPDIILSTSDGSIQFPLRGTIQSNTTRITNIENTIGNLNIPDVSNFVQKSGDTMTGDLNFSNSHVVIDQGGFGIEGRTTSGNWALDGDGNNLDIWTWPNGSSDPIPTISFSKYNSGWNWVSGTTYDSNNDWNFPNKINVNSDVITSASVRAPQGSLFARDNLILTSGTVTVGTEPDNVSTTVTNVFVDANSDAKLHRTSPPIFLAGISGQPSNRIVETDNNGKFKYTVKQSNRIIGTDSNGNLAFFTYTA